jgi:phage N-6-adenine-methyltransferase
MTQTTNASPLDATSAERIACVIIPAASIALPVGQWAERITAAWNKSREAIFEVGQLLLAAKDELPHGSFEDMVESKLPFGSRTARRLMSIARDVRLSDRTHGSVLPTSWRTLYELTKLSDETFEAGINRGIIRPDMERKDLRNLGLDDEDEEPKHVRGTFGTGENEWFTPIQFIDAARDVMGEIDLDPATHPVAQRTIRARTFFTAGDNGLSRPWYGRVWLNPPYAQPLIADFVNKMIEEYAAGRVEQAIMLTHNYTDTAWFQAAAASAALVCFTRGRVKFLDANASECAPTQGQAFFYFGPATQKFAAVFRSFGFVAAPAA